ncbi:hypothetical protein BGX29_010318 [Mortierella sp. GBA35]|nr:hypothetical protein BGX29_010318 [Mortierella sp. GBA35]
MSMATGLLHLEDTPAEDQPAGPGSGKQKGAEPTAETQPMTCASNTGPGAATAASADTTTANKLEDDDDQSIHIVDTETDIGTPATGTAPFEGDGADPAQAAALIPPRSTFDWLAYTVSLNYNRLATSVLSPITRWHWYDPIPHTSIILGAVPSQHFLAQLQRDHAVQDIVNMCAEFKGHLQTMRELGLVQCWLPTQDFHTPSVENIWAGVRFIDKCERHWKTLPEDQRGAIYVHCKAGRGRSATVVLCWLVYCYKLKPIEAQVDKNVYSHPEVIAFYEQVLDQESNGTLERKVWPSHGSRSASASASGNNSGGDAGQGGGV